VASLFAVVIPITPEICLTFILFLVYITFLLITLVFNLALLQLNKNMAIGRKVLKARAAKPKFSFKYAGTAPVQGAAGKYYPAEDVVLKKGPTPVRNAPKTRSSIKAGTVAILVAGRFRGKRVVVLKVLSSGLLLVSGPYNVNGVPLRRVNQKYVIATSTSVDVKGVDVSKIDDAFFARGKDEKGPSAARKAAQDSVDKALGAAVGKTEHLKEYMQAKFTLSKGDKPHAMKF
jgi:large subunit ribosomal protein L6e